MEILTVTLFVCMILAISYVLFGKEINRKKKEECEKNLLLRNFYQLEMEGMGKLQLEGTGSDGNSDFEFRLAVKRIHLPNDIRVQINE